MMRLIAATLIIVLASCSSTPELPDADRGFYEEVRSHSRSYALAKVRTDEDKAALRAANLSEAVNRVDLQDRIIKAGVDLNINKLRIDRILRRTLEEDPYFKVEEEPLTKAIALGILDIAETTDE